MKRLSPEQTRSHCHQDGEFAFLDIREILPFGAGHPFLAAHLPWSRFELTVTARVPRRDTPIVLCDQDGTLCERAASRLELLGYSDVSALAGGVDAWAAAGHALIPEIEVPAKGFGAFARIHGKPSYISPKSLAARLESGEDWVVIDSRPMDEFRRGNIPGSINAPGPDVLHCFDDLVPDPGTRVVVNCMSATRGTLGGLSLLAAGVPNEVHVLHHGTRGWLLDGLALEVDASRTPPPVSAAASDSARRRAQRIRTAASISTVDAATLQSWRDDATRTTYVFDVRSPAEFEAGHIAGARNAPEGRIVLSVEDFLATRNARIVLADDDTCRATVTALWLAQMGMGEVAVARGDGFPMATGKPVSESAEALVTLGEAFAVPTRSPDAVAEALDDGALLLDVGRSAAFCEGHIAGARWASRSALPALPRERTLIVTSEDGDAAMLAASDLLEAGAGNIAVLAGGNAAWSASGRALQAGEDGIDGDRIDFWLAASERPGDVTANVVAYLDWETQLLDEIHAAGETPYRNLIW